MDVDRKVLHVVIFNVFIQARDEKDASEAKVWQFLQASFSSNPTQAYLTMLGYDANEIFTKVCYISL